LLCTGNAAEEQAALRAASREAMASDLIILGINAYHADAAACIVRDSKLLAAAEEERFRRVKHWAGFPFG